MRFWVSSSVADIDFPGGERQSARALYGLARKVARGAPVNPARMAARGIGEYDLLPNLLATRVGRLAAFCLLYVTEGIPYGFVSIAITAEMKLRGFTTTQTALVAATIFWPWALKFLAGPVVDVVYSARWGRRRGWILAMQLLMVLSLMAVKWVGFGAGLFTIVAMVVLHNCFAAIQDVAIDALAVQTLAANERGLANGLMFGGAFLGQSIGGGLALKIADRYSFDAAYLFVAGAVLLVTVLVVLPMREPPLAAGGGVAPGPAGARAARIAGDIRAFARQAWQAFSLERAAKVALLLALLPIGAQMLTTVLINNIAVDVGMDKGRIGDLQLWSTLLGAAGAAWGGWMSDRFGRRRQLLIGILAVSALTLVIAAQLRAAGVDLPIEGSGQRPAIAAAAMQRFYWTYMVFSLAYGYVYGARFALFMDITNPAIAATQFTLYMAMGNVVNSYVSWLQGALSTRYGYPATLLIDAGLGLLCTALLPFLRARGGAPPPRS